MRRKEEDLRKSKTQQGEVEKVRRLNEQRAKEEMKKFLTKEPKDKDKIRFNDQRRRIGGGDEIAGQKRRSKLYRVFQRYGCDVTWEQLTFDEKRIFLNK